MSWRGHKDRIPSCLFTGNRHKALFLACQSGKVPLQPVLSLPLCCIDFKTNISKKERTVHMFLELARKLAKVCASWVTSV